MKNTYVYTILVSLFLLLGRVEVVCGQAWYEEDTWTKQTIKENLTINLTQNVKLAGTITIRNGCTLTINNDSGNNYTIQAIANAKMFDNEGTLIIKGNESSQITEYCL